MKCEWRKGKVINSEGDHKLTFYPCDNFTGATYQEMFPDAPTTNRCNFCHNDIIKPEETRYY